METIRGLFDMSPHNPFHLHSTYMSFYARDVRTQSAPREWDVLEGIFSKIRSARQSISGSSRVLSSPTSSDADSLVVKRNGEVHSSNSCVPVCMSRGRMVMYLARWSFSVQCSRMLDVTRPLKVTINDQRCTRSSP